MSEIRVTYRIETRGDPEALAAKIASDQSTGTFTELPGRDRGSARALRRPGESTSRRSSRSTTPSIPIRAGTGPYNRADVVVAYPLEAVGTDIAALMTIAVGGVYAARG